MTYKDFETYILTYIKANWLSSDAKLVSEYYALKVTNTPTLNVSIGVSDSEEGCLGTVGVEGKNFDLASGTITLLLKIPSDKGMTGSLNLIQKAIELFNRKMLNNGYIKFRACYKVDAGINEGSLYKKIICPFQIETIQ